MSGLRMCDGDIANAKPKKSGGHHKCDIGYASAIPTGLFKYKQLQ